MSMSIAIPSRKLVIDKVTYILFQFKTLIKSHKRASILTFVIMNHSLDLE